VVSPTGLVTVFYELFPDGLYSLGARGAYTVSAGSLSQQLAIPQGTTNPTLAWRYRLLGDLPGDTAGLEVVVEPAAVGAGGAARDASASAVLAPTGTGRWQLGWLDMGAWVGETVSVTFRLKQAAGAPYLQLFLDDISVGPTYPNLAVVVGGPPAAPPNSQPVLTIHSTNLGAVPAPATRLTVTLPGGLSYVSADPPPVTTPPLAWELGTLAAGTTPPPIRLTVSVAGSAVPLASLTATATITTAGGEVETANNTGQIAILVGYRTFFPYLGRP
jgi:hypothetical protein